MGYRAVPASKKLCVVNIYSSCSSGEGGVIISKITLIDLKASAENWDIYCRT